MKLVRVGKLILNMDHVVAIVEETDGMTMFFSSQANAPTNDGLALVTFEGELCQLMRLWLIRNGLHDLSSETPSVLWPNLTTHRLSSSASTESTEHSLRKEK